jgi:hypothetical protein
MRGITKTILAFLLFILIAAAIIYIVISLIPNINIIKALKY